MVERQYNHLIVNGEILLPDKRSLKAAYGLDHPEAYEPNDPRFLAEVSVDMGNRYVPGFVVSPPSEGWETLNYGRCFNDVSVVEVQQADGGYAQMGVHESRLWRHKVAERAAKLEHQLKAEPQIRQEESCENLESLQTRVEALKQTVTS